jgi:hypothetical protein
VLAVARVTLLLLRRPLLLLLLLLLKATHTSGGRLDPVVASAWGVHTAPAAAAAAVGVSTAGQYAPHRTHSHGLLLARRGNHHHHHH